MKSWSVNPALAVAPDTPKSTRSPGTREFDEIISADRNSSTGNMSDEEFLGTGGSPESSSQRRLKEPIPANRAALIRQIEDENRRLRERQRLRELGYHALLVMTIVVGLVLLTISLRLFYVAWRGTGEVSLTREDLRQLAHEAVLQARERPSRSGGTTRTTRDVHGLWDRVLEDDRADELTSKKRVHYHHQLHQRPLPTHHYPRKIISVPKKLSMASSPSSSRYHRNGPLSEGGEIGGEGMHELNNIK